MTNYGCWWWWLLLGGLLGWLASWWLGRKRTVTVERVVEKIVDRPVERIVEKFVDRPVDRVVEKPVDNPVHLDRIRALEAELAHMTALQTEATSKPATVINANLAGSAIPTVPSLGTAPAPEKPASKIMDRALEKSARESSK
jgi:hypothetical protein